MQDLSESDGCVAAVDETVDKFGGLDVLVNNAGVLLNGNDIAKLRMDDFDKTMEINVKAALRLTQLAVRHLEKSGDSKDFLISSSFSLERVSFPDAKAIVNVSSIAGLRAYPGALAYKMSKAAMDQARNLNLLYHFELRVGKTLQNKNNN